MLTYREWFLLHFVQALTGIIERAKAEMKLYNPQCYDFGHTTDINVGVKGRWGRTKVMPVHFRLHLQLALVRALSHELTIQWEGDTALEGPIRAVWASMFYGETKSIELDFPNQLKVTLRFHETEVEPELEPKPEVEA